MLTYDQTGNVIRRRKPDLSIDRLVETVDAAGGSTTYGYDAAGNRTSMTDPEGNTWRTEYDAMNRPVRVIDLNLPRFRGHLRYAAASGLS